MKKKPMPKLSKAAEAAMTRLEGLAVPPGTEDAYAAYCGAARAVEECAAYLDEAYASTTALSDDLSGALDEYQKRIRTAFGYLDCWRDLCAHIDDAVVSDIAEVRETIIDSMSDKLDEFEFTVNGGILGHKVALAIRDVVTEAEPVDVELCDDCA